jgi:Sec-independent protein translocase protein TatA
MLALIGNIDTTEVLIVLIGAVLVFGKRVPQVAAEAGGQLKKLRRSLDGAG